MNYFQALVEEQKRILRATEIQFVLYGYCISIGIPDDVAMQISKGTFFSYRTRDHYVSGCKEREMKKIHQMLDIINGLIPQNILKSGSF